MGINDFGEQRNSTSVKIERSKKGCILVQIILVKAGHRVRCERFVANDVDLLRCLLSLLTYELPMADGFFFRSRCSENVTTAVGNKIVQATYTKHSKFDGCG